MDSGGARYPLLFIMQALSPIVDDLKEQASRFVRYLPRLWPLYVMVIPALIHLALLSYYPMYGIRIAFQEYKPALGFAKSAVGGAEAVSADAGQPLLLADFSQYDRYRDLEDCHAAVLRGDSGAAVERGAEAVLQAERAEPGLPALFSVVDCAGRDHAGDAGLGGCGQPAVAAVGGGAADHLFGQQPDFCADAGRGAICGSRWAGRRSCIWRR